MNKTTAISSIAALCLAMLTGCRSAAPAPPRSQANFNPANVTICVLSSKDFGSNVGPDKIAPYTQIMDWMARDMVNLLTQRGKYNALVISSRSEFTPGPNQYLFCTRLVRYNAGSRAARALVGYGAGSCSLDIHYDFFGSGQTPVLAKDDGVGSSRDWRNCARKLNEQAMTAITAKLRAIQ